LRNKCVYYIDFQDNREKRAPILNCYFVFMKVVGSE